MSRYYLSRFRGGTMHNDPWQWRLVVTANAKTVSVETGYTWTDRYPYAEITHRVSAASIAEAQARKDTEPGEPDHPHDDENAVLRETVAQITDCRSPANLSD